MVTACIIQARLGSTRLPAKVLLPLPTGRTVLEEVLWRCKQIPGVDVVVAAIPDTAENNVVAQFAVRQLGAPAEASTAEKIKAIEKGCIVRGSEHDVLARYEFAARAVNADVIMRITADCPLLDPATCGEVLKLHQEQGADYTSNCWPSRRFPHGWDCEVFTRATLLKAHTEIPPMYETVFGALGGVGRDNPEGAVREHAGCPWMQKHPDLKIACLKDMYDRSHTRWTLDTIHDYTRIWSVFEQQMRDAA